MIFSILRSRFDSGIGATAYLLIFGYAARLIGSLDTHLIYIGELEGIDAVLSPMIRNQHTTTNREAIVYTSNQAAIRATCPPQRSSGQYILRRIIRQLDLLRDTRSRWRIQLQWVPGHEGVPGNEEADRLAKLAAVEASRRTRENASIAGSTHPTRPRLTPHESPITHINRLSSS